MSKAMPLIPSLTRFCVLPGKGEQDAETTPSTTFSSPVPHLCCAVDHGLMQGHYPKKLTGGHAIVGCDVATCGLVAAFLEEFFHEDHGYNIMHLVSWALDTPRHGNAPFSCLRHEINIPFRHEKVDVVGSSPQHSPPDRWCATV